jgi:hypothetical protein
LRAWHGRGEGRSPEIGHPPDAPAIETIVLMTFYEIITFSDWNIPIGNRIVKKDEGWENGPSQQEGIQDPGTMNPPF